MLYAEIHILDKMIIRVRRQHPNLNCFDYFLSGASDTEKELHIKVSDQRLHPKTLYPGKML